MLHRNGKRELGRGPWPLQVTTVPAWPPPSTLPAYPTALALRPQHSGQAVTGTQVSGCPGQCGICSVLWPVGPCPDGTGERSERVSEPPEVNRGKPDLGRAKTRRQVLGSVGPWGSIVDPPAGNTSRIRGSPGLSLGFLPPVPNQWLSQGAGVKAPPPLAALQISPAPQHRLPPTTTPR